ncbi:MAG: hypothetical protein IT443_12005 [Phycisphaeraceae bacterium]|nr:hypothetical protein [Phycisphaeraceae bacterium]
MKQKKRNFVVVTYQDVGHSTIVGPSCPCCGRKGERVELNFLLETQDIGSRIYLDKDRAGVVTVAQIETPTQRRKRESNNRRRMT